tara:strand:- start:34 stop:246 length:213 start_codon:yes stop_codon:yes gene_type:complete
MGEVVDFVKYRDKVIEEKNREELKYLQIKLDYLTKDLCDDDITCFVSVPLEEMLNPEMFDNLTISFDYDL